MFTAANVRLTKEITEYGTSDAKLHATITDVQESGNSMFKRKEQTMIYIDAEQLQDGLYNIKDGKIYKYKAKGGTVRAYKLENRPQGEWVPFEYGDERWHKCTACGVADRYIDYVERPNGTTGKLVAIRNYCPNCGARMKGADDETD